MKSLYVGNLPHSTSDSELRNMFAVYGAVETVNIIADRDTGRARGFAFVVMPNSSEAEMAIVGLNGSGLGGRALNVSEAKAKTDRPRGNGGQHFGRGGGGFTYAQESRRHHH
jgi:RNA recognition motif-containing protein